MTTGHPLAFLPLFRLNDGASEMEKLRIESGVCSNVVRWGLALDSPIQDHLEFQVA